jgi:hypothetical protein
MNFLAPPNPTLKQPWAANFDSNVPNVREGYFDHGVLCLIPPFDRYLGPVLSGSNGPLASSELSPLFGEFIDERQEKGKVHF